VSTSRTLETYCLTLCRRGFGGGNRKGGMRFLGEKGGTVNGLRKKDRKDEKRASTMENKEGNSVSGGGFSAYRREGEFASRGGRISPKRGGHASQKKRNKKQVGKDILKCLADLLSIQKAGQDAEGAL